MLLSVFFGIAKIWRQSNVHQQDKQAVAYPYNGIYSAIKRNELLIHTTTWMSLKTIMLSERVSQKRIYTILSPLSKTQEKCKLIYSDRRQRSNCLGKDGWKGQVDRIKKVHTATWGGNNTFIHWIVVMVLGVREYLVSVCVCAHAYLVMFDSATSQTVDRPASLSMGFSRQEYWSGFPFPSPRDLPNPGMESMPLGSSALAAGFFTSGATK